MSRAGQSVLTIVVLLPDVLGTYSDAGNAVVLAERARRRGVPAQVHAVGIIDVPPRTADIYLLGGGEDIAQLTAARWLLRHWMRDELAERCVVLAVCAGLQLLGTTMTDRSGHTYDGAGVLDVTTTPGARRAVGEVIATAPDLAIGRLTGFENHQGHTTLGPGARPLAVVERGVGNGVPHAGRTVEGVRAGSVIGTYLHGPVLARNPALADHLLTIATGLELPPLELPDQEPMRRGYLDLRRCLLARIASRPRA
jgi:CobQ-like glutamine amidotransferase family enzyme